MADFLSQLFCFPFYFVYHYNLTYVNKTQIRGDIKFESQLVPIQVSVHSDSKPLMSVLYVNQLETKTIFYFSLSVNSNSPLSNRI